jgi:amino acid adenylation domain-containing protein
MTAVDGGGVDRRLENLTPAQRALLEQRLMERRLNAARANLITARDGDGPAPLSYAQELLWLLSQVFDDGIAYNAPGAFQLHGKLELEILAQALQALVERHAILRTTYTVIDGEPVQVIGPPAPVEINYLDRSSLPADERQAAAQQVLKQESRHRFDLVNGPVLRPTVIRLGDDEHILMLNMHHIATDGYSRSALYRDLTALYDSLAKGLESPLTPLRIQYVDYATWHRRWLDGGVADAQIDYWKRKLAGAPSRLDLPTDFPRPPVRSWVGDNTSVMLDMATREALRAAAREADATLFVALLATFGLLLSRHSGQEDIVIGTPFAGRNRTELESMVGYFINPLALRLDLSGDPTFTELLGRTRETTLEAFANADVPYENVVRATNPQRDLSQTPVFQAMIVFHNPAWQTERPKFEPDGIRCTEITHEKGWSKFDLLLGMSERRTGLNTTWEYSTELFRKPTIVRMTEHFRALAQSAGSSPSRRLSRLSMLSDAERAKVTVSWNAHGDPLPESETIKDLFEAQAERTPDADAVVFGRERLDFAELNRRANRVAALLHRHGVGPGTLVGVLMEKSIDLVPAVLGVVKSGGAYIPLDPMYPPDRIEFMLSDARPAVVLTHVKHLDALPDEHDTVLALDAPGILDGLGEENPMTTATGDDLAYIIYTSGSTGKPKGAMIANRSLASAHFAYERAYRLRELTAHLQMASFSFDVFTGDLIRSLLVGAKLVLCPIEVVVDPPALYELMRREQIDAAEFVPATASLLFEHLDRERQRLDFMKLVIVSSEAWRNERYEFFKALCGEETRLINSYGLTEATIDSTWFEPGPDVELVPGRFVPIGRPLDNTEIYVLDSNLEPQPIGVPGELCVGGVAVARGYLNRRELTAERFVPDPFSEAPGALLYRTGDRARWLADGTIDFLGRNDRQLKIRGFRIEPGEIESVLERHPAVHAAAVTDRTDESGSARLVAYLTPAEWGSQPPFDELRTLVGEHLPAYMIPSAWVLMESLPLTPNGKVDLAALPDPDFDRSASASEFVAPRTETERRLAEVWSDVLRVEQVGVHDDFFALGGHSLLAVRLFSEIERVLGVRLPLAVLFQSATVADLAAMIDLESAGESTLSSIIELSPGDGTGRKPFFLVGWVDGDLMGYQGLAEHWQGQPLYGLLAPGVDGRVLPRDTIEGIAEHYIEEILSFQPEGPYYIGGFCFSGVVAFEMARQLEARGAELGMVALIDAYWHGSRRLTRVEIEREKWAAFRAANMRGRAAWVRRRAVGLKNRIRTELYFRRGYLTLDLLGRLRRAAPAAGGRRDLVTIAGGRAAKRYVPQPSEIRIDFFRAQTGESADPTVWEHLALGGVALHQVVSDTMSHVTILKEPGVRLLAAQMRELLLAGAAASTGNGSANGSLSGAGNDSLSGTGSLAPSGEGADQQVGGNGASGAKGNGAAEVVGDGASQTNGNGAHAPDHASTA